jgi:hypothetical protein
MGESARDGAQWLPSAFSLWELHSCKSRKCLESWLEMQKNTNLSPQNTIRKVMKRRCLKCPHIVHLNLICMGYDQKKGRKSNWKFDFLPQTLRKQGSNELWLGRVIQCWKDLFEGYKILTLHFQKNLIWKIYKHPKFWDSKSFCFGIPTWES